MAAGGVYGNVVVFNIEKAGSLGDDRNRPCPVRLEANNGELNSIKWGEALVTASDDGTVRAWRSEPSDVHAGVVTDTLHDDQ